MNFIDTQVISYVYSGKKKIDIENKSASSVAISEFLKMYIPNNYTSARFYPRVASNLFQQFIHVPRSMITDKKHNKFAKRRTDQIVVNLNGNYPSFIEFGSLALHFAFKNKNKSILLNSMTHSEKNEIKEISDKISFLFDRNIICVPLSSDAIETMLVTLSMVDKEICFKNNFRNSINDLFIASTAFVNNTPLVTEDKLLNKIIAKHLKVKITKIDDEIIEMITDDELKIKEFRRNEAKGYINRGWQYKMINGC